MSNPNDCSYDPACCLLSRVSDAGTGYHTRVVAGATVHPLRESASYAVELLERGGAADAARAADILRALLPLQANDPTQREFGIWSYYLEEPLAAMSPPDWNWADFIGLSLARILARHAHQLPESLRGPARTALRNAVWCIFRRNVGADYTNICALGGAVAGIAGEVLGEPLLVEYAARRLANLRKSTEATGDFQEYNSAVYCGVTLDAAEAVLGLCHDAVLRAEAERLRVQVWTQVTERWHPATQQLAGPHSRAYSNLLPAKWMERISHPDQADGAAEHLPCPEHLRPRLAALPAAETTLVRCVNPRPAPRHSTIATTWLAGDVCLGSASREFFWTQRRPLIAYWTTEGGLPAVLRLRFLKDGKDFSSAGAEIAQDRGRALATLRFFPDRGDWHPHLDRATDGVYRASRLVLRWELLAPRATAHAPDGHHAVLAAGAHRAIIHTLPGTFDGRPIAWRHGFEDGVAFAEAVLHDGAEIALDCAKPRLVAVATAVEILAADAAPCGSVPTLTSGGDAVTAVWDGLVAAVPVVPDAFG
jgi:hypothetical protein